MNPTEVAVDPHAAARKPVLLSSLFSWLDAAEKNTTAMDPVMAARPMSMSGSVQVEVQSGCSPAGRSGSSRLMPMTEQDGQREMVSARHRRRMRGRGSTAELVYCCGPGPVHTTPTGWDRSTPRTGVHPSRCRLFPVAGTRSGESGPRVSGALRRATARFPVPHGRGARLASRVPTMAAPPGRSLLISCLTLVVLLLAVPRAARAGDIK